MAISEVKKAVIPFSLEVKQLDWYTAYSISQKVAETYQKDRVFLAGDSCHTHSSGAAQVRS